MLVFSLAVAEFRLVAYAGPSSWRCSFAEAQLYADEIVHAEESTLPASSSRAGRTDLPLYLNNNLQFSSCDEYRYHEALVHPGLSTLRGARRVLVLGGGDGDGLALREILKCLQSEALTLVDLEPLINRLFANAQPLRKLNDGSLLLAKARAFNADALQWFEENDDIFDFVAVDFPDPSNFAIVKLCSASFYRLLDKHLAADALAVIQTTSQLYARHSFCAS